MPVLNSTLTSAATYPGWRRPVIIDLTDQQLTVPGAGNRLQVTHRALCAEHAAAMQ